jgi:hypothetical protein
MRVSALVRTILLCASALGVASAAAQSAQIADLKITLIDLDLADGIVPALSFSGPSSARAGYMYVSGDSAFRGSDSEVGSEAFGEVSAVSNGVARLSGDVARGEGFAFVSAGSLQPGYAFSNALLTLAGPQFTITPATELVISGVATVSSSGYLALELAGTTSIGHQDDFVRIFSPNSGSTETVFVSYLNTDKSDSTGSFTGWLGANASIGSSAAVPEPTVWACLMLGLAFFTARHGKPNQRAPGGAASIHRSTTRRPQAAPGRMQKVSWSSSLAE